MTVLQKILKHLADNNIYKPGEEVARNWLLMEQQQNIDAYNAGGQHEYGKNAYVKNPHPDLETYIQSLNQ